jgi:hypothetical protein
MTAYVPPTRTTLMEYACRQSLAVTLLAAAAWGVHQGGHADYVTPYLLMACALVPQVLIATVALGDEDRRRRLRSSARPAPVVLGCSAVGGWVLDQPSVVTAAAGVATAGLLVSASPRHLVPSRRAG